MRHEGGNRHRAQHWPRHAAEHELAPARVAVATPDDQVAAEVGGAVEQAFADADVAYLVALDTGSNPVRAQPGAEPRAGEALGDARLAVIVHGQDVEVLRAFE